MLSALDVVVLEFATGVSGPYTGKLFADLGAQVIKIEPPGGDPLRADPPLVDGESAFFAWLNLNKRSIIADPRDAEAARLVRHADIVLHNLRGDDASVFERGVMAANPAAVIVSYSPYGRSGPRAGWSSSPLTEWATSGFHYIAGDPAREPLPLPGYQAEFHAGLHAASATLAALGHARKTGEGQRIEMSHQEATLSDHCWLTTSWTHQGKIQSRTGSLYAPCSDGYVYIFNLVPYPNLFILMERFDLLEDEELQAPLNWQARFASDVLPAFAEWTSTRTKQEVYHACQELRVAASPVNTMKDVAENSQLAARDWFIDMSVGGRTVKAPGFPYLLSETPCALVRPAPAHGEHQAAVLSEDFSWANENVVRGSEQVQPGFPPLTGLRVLEVTANWAGPAAGRELADLGADVIKIELATKPATRALMSIPEDLWPDHYNRSGYFNKLNRNKRDVCLNLSTAEGRALFLRLVQMSDVVIENNAARVMGNLGLGYETLREANPALVMCSMSGFGSTGPERNYSAYGSNIETTSGLSSLLGYGPGEYFGTGSFYADPITGNHGAVAILAALHHRKRTGLGQWIDMSLLEAVTPFFAQQLLDYTVTGEVADPQANDAWGNLLEGVVRCAGRDCWLAVTVRSEPELVRLQEFLGTGAVSPEETWAGLKSWAVERDHLSSADDLQAAGITAAPVMQNWEIVTDNHLNDRGFFVPARHPVAGTFLYPGWPWRLERTPAQFRKAAPVFAESNDEVFGGMLGLSQEEQDALYATGVSARVPSFAAGSL